MKKEEKNHWIKDNCKRNKEISYIFILLIKKSCDPLHNNEDYKNSLYYFSLLEELDKDNPDVYYRLGDLEYILEEYEHSKIHLLKAIDLDLDNTDYYILLAKVYAKGYKNRKKTLEYLEKAFKNGFNDLGYLKTTEEFILLKERADALNRTTSRFTKLRSVQTVAQTCKP